MSSECLQLICNGELEIIKITEEFYEPAIKIFHDYFMKYENISIACNLSGRPETIQEMTTLITALLKDNISFAARDRKTQELVGICVNKLVNTGAKITLDEVFSSFKTPNMKTVGNYLTTMEQTYDIFREWKIDCVIELTFLSTRTDYGRRGIAVSLAKYLLEYAAQLKAGDSQMMQQLPQHLKGQKPQAIVAVFTSNYSQAVGEKLGFEILFKEENSKFVFEGKTFAEKIDPQHKYSVFAAKRL